MRKLLNTLYITTEDAYLSKDGLNVVVSVKQEERFRIPIQNIEGIVTFGYMGASPGLMRLCCDFSVSLCFLSPSGKFISRISGPTRGNVLLRKSQFEVFENESTSLHLSQIFIAGKIQNYRSILQRNQRDYGKDEEVEKIINQLINCRNKVFRCQTKAELLGVEGDAASMYFSVFNILIKQQKELFFFEGRNRRPPKDPTNALLSFSYTLLANEVQSALEAIGLDPYIGFFHSLRPGRASLALDLMEELRAYMGDRFVLSLINKKQIGPNDFIEKGNSPILTDTARKIVLSAWQQRKKEVMTHPFLDEKIAVGLLPYAQSMLLARYLRGDLDDYPTFIIR